MKILKINRLGGLIYLNLKNIEMQKKVLFIGLSYYNYPVEISKKIEEKGYGVKYYAIEPRTFFVKSLRYLSKSIYEKKLDQYHKNIIENEQDIAYDYVFFLTVHFFSHENITLLKESQPKAKFVLYNWDPVTQYNYEPYLKYFDRVLTFDPEDAKRLNINYLPLFASDRYFDVKEQRDYDFDVYMVGSIVKYRRYYSVQQFAKYCKSKGIKFKSHLKCTPVTYLRVLLKGTIPKDLKFHAIDKEEFFGIVENSKAVFDFSNHVQSGYTMRIAENLCAGKKIITNNSYIKNEKFYNQNLIFIYDGDNFEGVDEFLQKENNSSNERFSEWSIDNWVENLFGLRDV